MNTDALDVEHFADAVEHVVGNAAEAAGDARDAVDEVVRH